MKILRSCAVLVALSSLCSVAQAQTAQTANTQTDARDYEALYYLPNNTVAALGYFRNVSSSDSASFSQALAVFRASYILKFGDLAVVPFDMSLPVVDLSFYASPTTTLHTSGLADATYLPTVGYIIKEDEDTHTVIGATAYVTAPTGNYSTSQLVNLSDHRWRIEPQLVVSQRFLKVMTAELLGNLTFYTDNKDFPIPAATGLTTVTAQQALTFGLEGHVAADLSKTFYVAGAYYLAAAGKRNLVVPGAGSVPLDDAQTVQSLRFTYGIHIEKQSLLLLQYHQDIEASGGATISRFFGVRMSHVFF